MKRKLLITTIIILTVGAIGFYLFNRQFKLVDFSTINVLTKNSLSKSKVKIKRGLYSIDRKNDMELFASNNNDRLVYDGVQTGFLQTDYGENDFLLTYDDKYYFQFRHFIFNRRNQHTYNFVFSKVGDTVYIEADIKGEDKMKFRRPMHEIDEAKSLRCNVPIDTNKVIYNMTELKDR